MTNKNDQIRLVAREYLVPFILITLLFFMWGGARAVLDVLNKHFQLAFGVTKAHSALMQSAIYGAYFLMAIPAGLMIRRFGTRIGVIVGLILFGAGSLLFIPTSMYMTFELFLTPLFIIGCGLVILETAANPYVTLLGDPRTSAGRLNLAQSFNGLGSIMGVLLGGAFFLGDNIANSNSTQIALPYTYIGIIVLIVAFCFTRVKLPEVVMEEAKSVEKGKGGFKTLFFVGLFALVAYEIAEISINTFFINYMSDDGFLSPEDAALALSIAGLGLFMAGRVAGSGLMRHISSEVILLACAIGTIITMVLTMMPLGLVSRCALIVCYVFESIMFPTIFALSLQHAHGQTEKASSILMMSVVGGAIGPYTMGLVADNYSITSAFTVPLAGFVVVLIFALCSVIYMKKKSRQSSEETAL